MSSLPERLRSMRYELGETQQQVADVLNVKRATYTAYERGGVLPPYDKLKKLAEYFDVTVDYLMGETNFRKPQKVTVKAEIDLININNALRLLIDELSDKAAPVNADGVLLDDMSRAILKKSLESALDMGLMLSKQK